MANAAPAKREALLLRWKFFNLLTKPQYEMLEIEFGLKEANPALGSENASQILSPEKIKEIQAQAVLLTFKSKRAQMLKFEELLTTIAELRQVRP